MTTEKTAASHSEIAEDDLEQAAGGTTSADSECFFTCMEHTYGKIEGGYTWKPCDQSGIKCWGCACRGTRHCVDNWHWVDNDNFELVPTEYANHSIKKKGIGYHTPSGFAHK